MQRRQPAAGFAQQQIGGRKIPVVAVAADEGRIERALRDAADAQRQRADLEIAAVPATWFRARG